ncbi:MAG: hypothetical protein WAW36_16080 [Methylovulum miyakonense]|uniref:hypothetical protein n=1 Tax=Methylovulum miyakonense TaxID=645578 RepID=UPI003BB4B8A8
MSLLAIKGIYENGQLILEEPAPAKKTFAVVVTFLEEKQPEPATTLFSSFNFKKSQQISANLTTSLSEALIEERRENQ